MTIKVRPIRESGTPPAKFSISSAAKLAVDRLRAEYDARFPDDPAAVASVGWGIIVPDSGPRSERVVVGFYRRSQLEDVAHGIQHVSGVPLIFFTTPKYAPKFDGKVLDHANESGFFLRDP